MTRDCHSSNRFLFPFVSLMLLAAALLGGAGPRLARGEDAAGKNWPLFRGDAAASGVARTTLPDRPQKLWEFKVQGGAFESTAAIVDGVVYIGDMDGKLYALNLSDGKELGHFQVESGFLASPAVRDGLIYLGDIDGKCYCLDAKTLKEKWSFQTEAEVDSSANFWNDKVLFASQDRHLYCLDAQTGKEVWRFAIDDQIRCTPTVVGDRCFLAGCDAKLHIVDLTKGAGAAAVPIDAPTGVTPAVLGERVFFGTQAGVFFAVNWKEARVDWTFEDPNASQPYQSSAAVKEGIVVVSSRNRAVQAFDPATGKEKWSFPTRQRIDSSPVIAGPRAYVGAADGRLYAIDLASGKEAWQEQLFGGISGSPAVAAGRLVIATDRGVVYCFGGE